MFPRKTRAKIKAEWHRGRVFDQQIANLFFKRLKGHREAKVEKVQKKQKAKQRPQALNTVELLRVCSAKLGTGIGINFHTQLFYTGGVYKHTVMGVYKDATSGVKKTLNSISNKSHYNLDQEWCVYKTLNSKILFNIGEPIKTLLRKCRLGRNYKKY